MDIAIHYDPSHGYDEAALIFARQLFARYDEAIVALALVPEAGADLTVYLNGTLVHSTVAAGRLPRLADLDAGPAGTRSDSAEDATR